MPTVSIVVESKFGNTAKVAEAIAKSLMDSGFGEVKVSRISEADAGSSAQADVILIGSPNHVGGPTRTVKKFMKAMSKSDLSGKSMAFFDTYIGKDIGKAVRKMESDMASRNSRVRIVSPGLSLRVKSMKGPLDEGEIDKADEFVRALSAKIKNP
ncbi:MAG: hypothetical protein JSU93_01080 [Methanobacteriota archaeon]|nr:MAG: hypothetical protein JSU93_01080 [Euryarchaeota archaeon]